MREFNGKISIEQVVNSLNAFKKAIYNVNYINKLIIQNQAEIIDNDRYDLVINRFVSNKFPTNKVDISIASIPLDKQQWTEGTLYFENINPNWSNQKLNNKDVFTTTISKKVTNVYSFIQNSIENCSDYLHQMITQSLGSNKFYQIYIKNWINEVEVLVRCIQPDILNTDKWITVVSSVKLSDYFTDNTTNLSVFSPEYIHFMNKISALIQRLESNNWNDTTLIKNIWEYSNISNIDNTKCLYSEKYPNWDDQLISDCFIPNSNINVQSSMTQLFKDIYLYYPSLSLGELAFSTYNENGKNLLCICKIDTYPLSKQCIKVVTLDLQKMFIQNNVIGDTIFNGNLQINDSNGQSVIETDNVTKNISIHGKVGINQDLHEIKGLLDIDNLSVSKIYKIVDSISIISNTSYNVVNTIKPSILLDGTFTIAADYVNDVIVFKVPISNKIKPTDINFLYKPSNIFKSNDFSDSSFLKIQLIVNEINRMGVEILNYNNKNGENLVMSFVELLNDTKYYYICSLKAIIKDASIYFVMSFTPVQHIMIDNSYRNIFTNLMNDISGSNRALNYSILVINIDTVYNKLLEKDSVNSFTKYFQDGEFSNRFDAVGNYQFCCTYETTNTVELKNLGHFLFHEVNTHFNGNKQNEVYIPGTDKTDGSTGITVMKDFAKKYGQNKYGQNFCVNCTYTGGNYVCVINKILIRGIEYVVGNGTCIQNFVDNTILSKGDNCFTGSLLIQDIDSKNIFEVNTEEKKIVNMYNTGFGTEYPKTILDVNDSGLTDIINIIKDISMKEHTSNLYTNKIKDLPIIDATSIDTCIQSFIDPSTGKLYIQTKDNYFFCHHALINDNPDDLQLIYLWLYRKWDDKHCIDIDDPNNKTLINTVSGKLIQDFKTQYSFDNGQNINNVNWTFGEKMNTRRFFEKAGKRYAFGSGVNIGNYNIKYNNNGNISTFFDYMKYMNLYLQHVIIRYTSIHQDTIPNYASINDYFSIISNRVSPSLFALKKIQVNFNTVNYNDTIVSDLDFNTLAVSGSGKSIIELHDVNILNKYSLFCYNLYNTYSKSNSNKKVFNKGDYGMIDFEDNYTDFMSLFYCSDVTGDVVTLISIELQLNTVIKPSVDIRGDLRIKGDTYFHDDNTNTDFVSIDTNESFMGVGTNVRYANYSNNYITTTRGSLSNQHFIVSGSHFPIAIAERYSEVEPERNLLTGKIENYKDINLELMKDRTTFTARRSSKYYTIDEMDEYAKKYHPNALLGPYAGQPLNNNKYGPDINFEIQDMTQISRELGNIHMVIDSIDADKNIRAGFGINFVDTATDGSVIEREVMYINNNGRMAIDTITLGMDPTTTNNIVLSSANSELVIDGMSLTDIINKKISEIFSIDSSTGELTVTLGVLTKTYVPK